MAASTQGVRVAEHRGGHQRLVVAGRHLGLDHAADRPGRPGEDLAADPVDARHVDDAGDHHDVLDADVARDVGAGHGGDHHLGHAQRQGPHGRAGDRGAAAAAQGHDAVEAALGVELRHQGARRRGLMAATASPRSCWRPASSRSTPAACGHLARATCPAAIRGGPSTPTSISSVRCPRASMHCLTKPYSAPWCPARPAVRRFSP